MKKEIALESSSPLIKKFSKEKKNKIQTHYKDASWSVDLIDKTPSTNITKRSFLPKFDNQNK